MADERLIKKYPNRRLYDTSKSRYITRDEVRDMVRDDIEVKVVEQQSREDITRHILLQIIVEQESAQQMLFSNATLAHFIRHCDTATRSDLADYLESSLRFFNQRRQQFGSAPDVAPLECWTRLGSQDIKIWQNTAGTAPGPEKDHQS